MTHRRSLLALYGTAALLAAPWAIDWLLRRQWRPPAVPSFRVTTGRLHR